MAASSSRHHHNSNPVTVRLCLCFTTPPLHHTTSLLAALIDVEDFDILLGGSTTSFSHSACEAPSSHLRSQPKLAVTVPATAIGDKRAPWRPNPWPSRPRSPPLRPKPFILLLARVTKVWNPHHRAPLQRPQPCRSYHHSTIRSPTRPKIKTRVFVIGYIYFI